MKLKTIASIFNRNKRLIIYTAPNGEQWISNGYAAYTMRGLPHMTPEVVLRIFDVPEDKRSKWHCEESELPTAISFEDTARGETDIDPLKTNVELYGVNYWLFVDGMKIYSFDEDFMRPLLGEPAYLKYYKRETIGGGFVLACKVGLELKAIIAPRPLHNNEDFIKEIGTIAALYDRMARDTVVNSAYEVYGTQDTEPPPEVGPDTGEILDGQLNFDGAEGGDDGGE